MTACRALLLVCLLAFPLRAETTVMPTPGKAVGVVTSTEAGKWIVLAADFTPVNADVRDSGKVCIFEGSSGKYAVFLIPPGDAQPKISIVVLGAVGPAPPTIPPVIPPINPQVPPVNPPQPAPLNGMRVMILDETSPTFTSTAQRDKWQRQITALRSLNVKAYLDAKTIKGADGWPGWRKADPSDPQAFRNLPREWQDFRAKLQPTEIPWVAIADSSGNVVSQGPPPLTEAELLAYLKQYGG